MKLSYFIHSVHLKIVDILFFLLSVCLSVCLSISLPCGVEGVGGGGI